MCTPTYCILWVTHPHTHTSTYTHRYTHLYAVCILWSRELIYTYSHIVFRNQCICHNNMIYLLLILQFHFYIILKKIMKNKILILVPHINHAWSPNEALSTNLLAFPDKVSKLGHCDIYINWVTGVGVIGILLHPRTSFKCQSSNITQPLKLWNSI